jgi:hypothetical protein
MDLSLIKMVVLPKLIYRFTAISNEILVAFPGRTCKLVPNFIYKYRDPEYSASLLPVLGIELKA